MELRHLRRFLVLAEELHFTRAAVRLHMEQPPLSRAIKELEDELGVALFSRNRRGTRLSTAGVVFLKDVRKLFDVLEQARENARAAAAGLLGRIHIAISDGAIDQRLSLLLARSRAEEPEVEIRVSEVSLSEQLRGLRSGDFAIGFAHTGDVEEGIISEPVWTDSLVVVLPARHPLLSHRAVPLEELAYHPLVLGDPIICEGFSRELVQLFSVLQREPKVVEHVLSVSMMLTLVGAGYGIGITTSTKTTACTRSDVVIRPLAMESPAISTYLLRLKADHISDPLERFIRRLHDQKEI
ncbi:LysR family transcriptional regulator [Pseudomonas aeruginosa]|nr:LysR family transcriptional regulator [Pseudomonas aeruginosa]